MAVKAAVRVAWDSRLLSRPLKAAVRAGWRDRSQMPQMNRSTRGEGGTGGRRNEEGGSTATVACMGHARSATVTRVRRLSIIFLPGGTAFYPPHRQDGAARSAALWLAWRSRP